MRVLFSVLCGLLSLSAIAGECDFYREGDLEKSEVLHVTSTLAKSAHGRGRVLLLSLSETNEAPYWYGRMNDWTDLLEATRPYRYDHGFDLYVLATEDRTLLDLSVSRRDSPENPRQTFLEKITVENEVYRPDGGFTGCPLNRF